MKITGISLPVYLLIVLILIVTMALGKLPKGILGPLAVLVIFGNLFHFLGNKIPIYIKVKKGVKDAQSCILWGHEYRRVFSR